MDPGLLAGLAARSSHFRGPPRKGFGPGSFAGPGSFPGGGWFKEWLHFCIFGPQVELLVNLSLMERAAPGDRQPGVTARLVVLARTEGVWTGSVEEIPGSDLAFAPGQVDALFGDTALRCRSGAFEMLLKPRGMSLSGRLRLEPTSLPLVRPRTELGEAVVSWLAIPRLRTFGSLTINGKASVLRGSPAYHDHNWGAWQWGKDFFWQWAFGLPADEGDPWTIVFYRLFNRVQTVEHALALLVWRGQQLFRVFHAGDVTVGQEGFLRARRIAKLPPVMGLLVPQLTTDVPRRLVVTAEAGDDQLRFEVDNWDLAQVLIPNEADLGTTVINEVVGSFRARGRIRGIDVETSGASFHEHVGQS